MTPPCKHCMRGDPQNVDISLDAIDKLLDQTEMIDELIIGGGEPFLNVQAMLYIIAELRRRHIPLYRLSITTNGKSDVSLIKQVVQAYNSYIKACRANPYNRFRAASPDEPLVLIEVSYDRYHHENNYPMLISRYRSELSNLARIFINPNGLYPRRIGRAATHLKPDDTIYHVQPIKTKIGLLDASHKPYCEIYQTWQMRHENQIIICCPITMTAKGNILRNGDYTYTDHDNPHNIVCAAGDDIYSAILKYNENKPDCISSYLIDNNEIDEKLIRDSVIGFIRQHSDEYFIYNFIGKYHRGHKTTDIPPETFEYEALNDNSLPKDYRKRILDNLKLKTQTYDYTQKQPITADESIKPKWDSRENEKWKRIFAGWIEEGRADNILQIAKNKSEERKEEVQKWLTNQTPAIL